MNDPAEAAEGFPARSPLPVGVGSLQDTPDTTTGPSVDAVRLVADVLRQHRPLIGESGPDTWFYPSCEDCPWTDSKVRSEEEARALHDDHVAAAVVAALGGLTRAWAAVFHDDSYMTPFHEAYECYPGDARKRAEVDVDTHAGTRLASRWVSGWTPEETQ